MAAILWVVLASAALGGTPDQRRFFQAPDERLVDELVRKDHAAAPGDLKRRVSAVSERFLGTPYKLGPLGEGPDGEFDRDPTISFRQLDCTTYVEEVMAISLEPDLARAKSTLQKIRYKGGVVRYDQRNHFPEIDWIPNNIAAGYLRDITREVAGEKTKSVSRTISKPQWYEHMEEKDLSAGFEGESAERKAARVARWRELGKQYQDEQATLEYLPMESLPEFIDRIPSGTVVNLIREPSAQEPFPILVSHQMLLIATPEGRVIRHAAFGKTVEQVPALAFFYRYFNAKWRVLGINLNEIRDPASKNPAPAPAR